MISDQFVGRTGDMIKNRFYSCLEKKVHKYKISKKYTIPKKSYKKAKSIFRKRLVKTKKNPLITLNKLNEDQKTNSNTNNTQPVENRCKNIEIIDKNEKVRITSPDNNLLMANDLNHQALNNISYDYQFANQKFQFENFLNYNLSFHLHQLNSSVNHFKMLYYFSCLNSMKK